MVLGGHGLHVLGARDLPQDAHVVNPGAAPEQVRANVFEAIQHKVVCKAENLREVCLR